VGGWGKGVSLLSRPMTQKQKKAARSTPQRPKKGSAPWPVREIIALLEPVYGPAHSPRDYDPVSELIYTILSQNTSDRNSVRAYAQLRQTYKTWEEAMNADIRKLEECIRIGGLARVKAPRIQGILKEILSRKGALDLYFLKGMPLKEAKDWLSSLPGVGPKTAACVLIFSLDMPALPVDTHVYRVARRLALIGPKVTAAQSHDILESMLKPEQVLPFHVYLITHGRRVCKAPRPLCHQCVLEKRCPSSLLRRE